MIVQLGAFEFEPHEASVEIRKRGLVGDNGFVYAWEHNWDISGRLIRDTQAQISAAIQDLELGVQVIQGDCVIKFDNGNATEHIIPYDRTLDGVKVTIPPSYPTSAGAEYVTYRTFALSIQAEVGFNAGTGNQQQDIDLVQWEETVTISGGDPIDRVIPVLNGSPVQQRVSPQGPWIGHQRGSAVSNRAYPTPPAILAAFRDKAIQENSRTRVAPTENRAGNQNTQSNFAIQWSYRVASAEPLTGEPTRRP